MPGSLPPRPDALISIDGSNDGRCLSGCWCSARACWLWLVVPVGCCSAVVLAWGRARAWCPCCGCGGRGRRAVNVAGLVASRECGRPAPGRRVVVQVRACYWLCGGVLLSRRVAPAVPLALVGLASGFGMGPGVSLPLWPPQRGRTVSSTVPRVRGVVGGSRTG